MKGDEVQGAALGEAQRPDAARPVADAGGTSWSSAAAGGAHVLGKLIVNLLLWPWYLARNPRWFVDSYLRRIVDETINMGLAYRREIEMVDMERLQEILGGPPPNLFLLYENRYGNINFMESIALSYVIQAIRPRTLFEIGTFDGFSTYHLARNAGDEAKVFTLNLPPETPFEQFARHYSLTEFHGDRKTHAVLQSGEIGFLYKKYGMADRVTQLFGNSLEFDFSPWTNAVDFCFIDGGHSYVHVESDTRRALAMVRPGGVIAWHDYNAQHRDIRHYLSRLARTHKLYHIKDTRLVIHITPS